MSEIFSKDAVVGSTLGQDRGRLDELDRHELLQSTDANQVASFDQVKAIGAWFLGQKFSTVLPSSQPLPLGLVSRHLSGDGGAFLGKLALGADPESQFPVTIEVVQTTSGPDLRMHIVPIHFGALEVSQFGHRTDSLLALAAAAAVAPQFLIALEGGISTTVCASKKEVVTSITPDYGTPLAVAFDSFGLGQETLKSAVAVTGNRDLSIKQAAHLHGQKQLGTQSISRAAAGSRIAAGVPIRTVLRSELPRHALFLTTALDTKTNMPQIVTLQDSLRSAALATGDLSFLAAALGFTARVVGDSEREQRIESVLAERNADTPLMHLVTR